MMMGERRIGEKPRRRHAEVAGDISVGAIDAATDVQMPKVFEIVLSTGVGRQLSNTCVIFGRMRIGSAHIYIDIFTLAIEATATYHELGFNYRALSLHRCG